MTPIPGRSESTIRYRCLVEGRDLITSVDLSGIYSKLNFNCESFVVRTTDGPGDSLSSISYWPLVSVRARPDKISKLRSFSISKEIDAVVERVSISAGVPTKLLRALIYTESNFDPSVVSPKGAIGLMQIMPSTARELGVVDASLLFDPALNIEVGARYLASLLNRFEGRVDLALAAYNAGSNAVIRHGYAVPPYRETRRYVEQISAMLEGD